MSFSQLAPEILVMHKHGFVYFHKFGLPVCINTANLGLRIFRELYADVAKKVEPINAYVIGLEVKARAWQVLSGYVKKFLEFNTVIEIFVNY